MSQFRIEKSRKVKATIATATGPEVSGTFFLADATSLHSGPERVSDLLNESERFFPFEVAGPDGKVHVGLFARAHVLYVQLAPESLEAEGVAELAFASDRPVSLLLTNGERLRGELHVATPDGMDRVSDFANRGERFQYFGSRDKLSMVNLDHIIEILPM
jgi:hypothetical protein